MDAPDYSAVDLAVDVMKSDPKALHYSGLGNAILRRLAAEKADILADAAENDRDTPEWLAERWSQAYGAETANAIQRFHGLPPHIDLTLLRNADARIAEIGGVRLSTGSLRLETDQPVTALPGFEAGDFQVQDVAAALPARLLNAKPGMLIHDLCAAPGGKTAQLAATGAQVTAVERSADRAKRLSENLARLDLKAELVISDAASFAGPPADGVLLDAPCSATGTIRRHPEIAWTKTLADILALARQQEKLLDHAATLVKPGGMLVFATCSLEPEEGERQIDRFLARNKGFALVPARAAELGTDPATITPAGMLRVLPCHFAAAGGADGFFAARLQRIA